MLVLSRKVGDKVRIGGDTVITITKVVGSRVSISFDAPPFVHIIREELHQQDQAPKPNADPKQ